MLSCDLVEAVMTHDLCIRTLLIDVVPTCSAAWIPAEVLGLGLGRIVYVVDYIQLLPLT